MSNFEMFYIFGIINLMSLLAAWTFFRKDSDTLFVIAVGLITISIVTTVTSIIFVVSTFTILSLIYAAIISTLISLIIIATAFVFSLTKSKMHFTNVLMVILLGLTIISTVSMYIFKN